MPHGVKYKSIRAPECRFCSIVSNQHGDKFDTVLLASDNFLVIPALGHFCPGYLMLISKDHIRNFAQITDRRVIDELERLSLCTRWSIEPHFGRSIVFEHGPLDSVCSGGSSVDHAHLHFVPTQVNVLQRVAESRTLLGIGSRLALPPNAPYLYIEDQSGNRFLATVREAIRSQYLRRLTYQALYPQRNDDGWDWHTHPHEALLEKTLSTLGRLSYSGKGESGQTRVYLAMAMDGLASGEIRRREQYFKNRLKHLPIDLFTTFVGTEVSTNRAMSPESVNELVERDLAMLRDADILLVDYSRRGHNFVGCTCEIVYAHLLNKPVIAYTGRSGNHRRIWLSYHADFICQSMQEVVEGLVHAIARKNHGEPR